MRLSFADSYILSTVIEMKHPILFPSISNESVFALFWPPFESFLFCGYTCISLNKVIVFLEVNVSPAYNNYNCPCCFSTLQYLYCKLSSFVKENTAIKQTIWRKTSDRSDGQPERISWSHFTSCSWLRIIILNDRWHTHNNDTYETDKIYYEIEKNIIMYIILIYFNSKICF